MHNFLSFLFIVLLSIFTLFGCSQKSSSESAQSYLARADAYRDQGQYRAAIIEVTNAMHSAPDEVEYAVEMAEIYNTLGAGRRASNLLEPYLEEAPQVVSLPLAEAYLMQGKFLSAQEALQNFVPVTEGEERQVALYRADVQRVQGNLEVSEKAYEQLRQSYPDDVEVDLRLVENYAFQGRWDHAFELLESLQQQYPEEPKLLRLSAVLALHDNQLAQAERHLTDALMQLPTTDIMLPERVSVLELLIQTLTSQGRMAEALVYQKLLAEASPDSVTAQQQLQEAATAAEAGGFEKAEAILEALLEENPESQSASLMLGMVSLSLGDFKKAEPLLSRSVDVETADTQVIRAAVLAQAHTGNAELALSTLRRSLEARPNNAILLSLFGVLSLNNPELENKGYLSLQKALALDPHRGAVRLALANYHFQQNEPEQAMGQLRRGFNFQPADWAVTDVYFARLMEEGAWSEVARALATLKKAAPKAPETALLEAQYRFFEDSERAGIAALERLLNIHPGFARGHGVLAQMYYEQNEHQKALDSIERVLEIEPNNHGALRVGIAIVGDPGPARDWLAKVAGTVTGLAAEATALQAMLFREEGEIEQAVDVMASYQGPQTAHTRQVNALIYRDGAKKLLEEGHVDQARARLGKALQLFPASKALNLDLVKLELSQRRLEDASLLLADLAMRFPDDAEITVLQAQATQIEHGDSAAFEQLKTSWDAQPSNETAGLLLFLARSEAPESIPDILAEWEAVAPDSRNRLLFIAEEHQRTGNENEAARAYEQLLASNPHDVVALNNLAWMLRDKELPRALTLAEQAAVIQPDSAAVLDTYGWLLHLNGDHQEAVDWLERAASLAPRSDAIRQNLESARGSL